MATPATSRASVRAGLPAITPAVALCLLAGAVAPVLLPEPVPRGFALVLAVTTLPALVFLPRLRLATWFALGFAWCTLRAGAALDARLPKALEGQDIEVTGRIVDLPQIREDGAGFEFHIERATLDGEPVALTGRVRLGWYRDAPALEPCARWRLTVRLKRPRGLVNPGGFDFERAALQRGIVATGYVRDAEDNRELSAPGAMCVDGLRARISATIAARLGEGPVPGLLRATAVGDRAGLDEAARQVLRANGVSHLIAISGLHIGLFALLGGWFGRLFWKLAPRVTLRVPAPMIETPLALAFAIAYAALAGFGLPTTRALLMIAAVAVARLARRGRGPGQGLALAATGMVLWDPLAVLSEGFWLSFAGVAVLATVLSPRAGKRTWWRELPRAQLALSVALLPLTVWFFGQGSLIGPIANLVAVPWVSLVVTPLAVAASLLALGVPVIGVPLLKLAALSWALLWWLLERLADLPGAQWHFAVAPPWAFALALVGAAWCLLPRGVPARGLGLLLVLPLLVPAQRALGPGEFEALVIDVGQGLSVLVRTGGHALLYDTGARYPGGFDLGEAVVVPSLQALGIDRLDRLVVSHGDNDHAGGARAVALALAPKVTESGEPERLMIPAHPCVAGTRWDWEGVAFRMLSPAAQRPAHDNDRSCVLAVDSAHGSLLLTGDVTARMEPAIAAASGPMPRPLALVVPHHGSKTSSSAGFLDAVHPDIALVSAGYRSRFGHPHPTVVARYAERDVPLFNTAGSGYLRLRFAGGDVRPVEGRLARAAYWRER